MEDKAVAVLSIDVRLPNGSWARVNGVRPSDPPGSMSDNRENGQRDVIVFACSADKSTILRVPSVTDVEIGSSFDARAVAIRIAPRHCYSAAVSIND